MLLSRIVLLDGCMINCFRRFQEWFGGLLSRHRVEQACRALPSVHSFFRRLLVWTSQRCWRSCQMQKAIQKSKDSRNDLTSCEVRNEKAKKANHRPTTICLFCFFWITCVILDKLRLCLTAKDVLLAVLSDHLRRRWWWWWRHYWK